MEIVLSSMQRKGTRLHVAAGTTVQKLKTEVEKCFQIPAAAQKLMCKGKVLISPTLTLEAYHVENGDEIYIYQGPVNNSRVSSLQPSVSGRGSGDVAPTPGTQPTAGAVKARTVPMVETPPRTIPTRATTSRLEEESASPS